MKISPIKIVKKDERGTVFDLDKLRYVEIKRGSVSKPHSHRKSETLFILKGKVKYRVDGIVKVITGPKKVVTPKNAEHELKALTNVVLAYY